MSKLMLLQSYIWDAFKSENYFSPRAQNNGWSTDNVWPDWGFDRSNVLLAGHVDRTRLLVIFIMILSEV